jgi:endonuclease/exonuclease/phosphatase family metal-dependent hydrolase
MEDRNKFKLMKVFFSLTIILGLLVICGFFSCETAKGADSNEIRAGAKGLELRIMTFNIRYGTANDGEDSWDKRKDMVCDVLRRHDPDIVGLQEALRFQIDYIRSALPEYGEIGVGRDDGKTQGEYSAILYRKDRMDVNESGTFWLSDTPAIPGSTSWGNKITRICTWGRFILKESGKAFYLFNTHLDHQSQPSREKSIVLLAQRIHGRKQAEPFVLTGDFNVGETNTVVMYLKGKSNLGASAGQETVSPIVVVDTFRVLHPGATEVGTFNGFKGDRLGEKIDYVFAPPTVKVLEARILRDDVDGRYPSDHFPVMARLHLSTSDKH